MSFYICHCITGEERKAAYRRAVRKGEREVLRRKALKWAADGGMLVVMPSKDRLRPIETAPRDGTKVMLYYGDDAWEIGYWTGTGWSTGDGPTDWESLPESLKASRATSE